MEKTMFLSGSDASMPFLRSPRRDFHSDTISSAYQVFCVLLCRHYAKAKLPMPFGFQLVTGVLPGMIMVSGWQGVLKGLDDLKQDSKQ